MNQLKKPKITWEPIVKTPMYLEVQTKLLPLKGNLVYEYNPLRNYRLNSNMYEYLGALYSLGELLSIFGISLNCKAYRKDINNGIYDYKINPTIPPEGYEKADNSDILGNWIKDAYKDGNNLNKKNLEKALKNSNLTSPKDGNSLWVIPFKSTTNQDPILREEGELVDFITDELKLNLNHPVHIIPLNSYDGSVNLIINDGINIPRLINTRFSATGKNTYEIVDRKGNNDTNIYDLGDLFDIDTSLYKRIIKIPKICFRGVHPGGNLKIGNYHFYFKLADADGNETDFVGESGLVSVFIGFNDPQAVHTGTYHENSYKLVSFQLYNLDSSYDYVTVYYTRNTAEANNNSYTEYEKINKNFIINNANVCNINITGFERTSEISESDINLNYNTVDSVYTSASCQNILFLANVHKPDIPYEELSDLSLRFLPYLKLEVYDVDMSYKYSISTSNKGYLDPLFIYNKTGYWGNEIYRLGIVYIMPNGDLSPVFNIRGSHQIPEFNPNFYSNIPLYEVKSNLRIRKHIEYNENDYTLIDRKTPLENVKGVVSFKPSKDTDTIYSIDIRVDSETISELKKYVKGYFFVRLSRIPTVLAQGITIGIDKESRTPTIPTADGFLNEINNSLEKTHVKTTIGDVNYISEGFLTRYRFDFKKKKSGLFKKILLSVGIAVAVVAAAAATVFTAGAAGAVMAGAMTMQGVAAAGFSALGAVTGAVGLGSFSAAAAVGVAAGVAGAATGVGLGVAGGILELRYSAGRMFSTKKFNGRETKIPSGYELIELDNSRILGLDFKDRVILKDSSSNYIQGILCPDYEVNLPYYNNIFIGNEHLIESATSLNINRLNGHSTNYFTNDERHFYVPSYKDKENSINVGYYMKVISVPDNTKCVGLGNLKFRSLAGEPGEAWRYECISDDYKSELNKSMGLIDFETISNKQINSDIIRGSFGAYLAIDDTSNRFSPAETVNIYIPDYSPSDINNYFNFRMSDNSSFKAISDRFDIQDLDDYSINFSKVLEGSINREGFLFNLYRGDCYLCLFTHRINRNFNDPNTLFNDEVVDNKCWKNNYDPNNSELYSKINLSDVDAILLGMWVTFRVRSTYNLNIRTLDGSQVEETAMVGHPRGFYPYYPMTVEGVYKHPDSEIHNLGFHVNLSSRWNFEIPDVPHIKNWFGTRIIYSDIHVNDAFKNGFRVFLGNHFRDYTREYGLIIKLISLNSSLLCVFEHGVGLLPVKERALAGEGQGGNIYINTSNVLPDSPKILSDMFGSQWADSVLKVPGKSGDSIQYVYGVDTVAKKIWRTDGNSFLCISDFKVLEFLNSNITLGERENTPKIGIRNVKTVYNAYKRDVMFTFYDNTYGFEEKVWNLCWNEILLKFITFYSWVPSMMENINNVPFSFNRDTSKWIAKLGTSHADNSFSDGITLTNVIINRDLSIQNPIIPIKYINDLGLNKIYNYKINLEEHPGYIGALSLQNRILPSKGVDYVVSFELLRDCYQNYKNFKIEHFEININNKKYPIYYLALKQGKENEILSEFYYRNKLGNVYADVDENKIKSDIETSINNNYPIFKNLQGKRPSLPYQEAINPNRIVSLLNIKAIINIIDLLDKTYSDSYYNSKASFSLGSSLINGGYYESAIAVIPKWNMLFLTTDFWKHGLAGLIDISDKILPTYWYGCLHPFEFECVVVNDPSIHKIFTNLEIISNNVKPESFHYEIIGDSYDFSKDKPNIYFRQEALKALWQYNGMDIQYDPNFIKTHLKQLNKSSDLIHKYYSRLDTINNIYDTYNSIEDYYKKFGSSLNHDYDHLSGSEIVYYPNRQEYRVWTHAKAVDIDDLDPNNPRSIITANCKYLENKWRVTINPILICYKNEFNEESLNFTETTWVDNYDKTRKLPRIALYNSPIPDSIISSGIKELQFPGTSLETSNDKNNSLYHLYDLTSGELPIDTDNWLNSLKVTSANRKELDIKDKFMKVRIRYTGDRLAVIDFLNTIYKISYA